MWNYRSSQDCLWKSTTPFSGGLGRVETSSLQLRRGLDRVEEGKGAVTCPPCFLSPLKTSSTRDAPVGLHRGPQGTKAQPWPGVTLPKAQVENSAKESADLPGTDTGPVALSGLTKL